MQILAKSGAVSKEVLDKNQTALVEAQTMLAKQKNVLEEDKLIAPFSGVLSSYKFDVGAYISSGTNVVELTQEAPLKVNYALSADYRPKISIGDKVTITSSTYPNKSFYGVVSYIAPTVNSTTGTIDIEAKVPNKQFLLSPGMFVNVIQTVDSKRDILVVPDTSIQADQNGQYVFLVDKNNTVKKVYIKQGMLRDGWAQVLSPLKEGDTVVSIGGFKLNDGDHISISKIPPPDFNKTIKVQLTPGNTNSTNTTNSEITDKQTKDSSSTKKGP